MTTNSTPHSALPFQKVLPYLCLLALIFYVNCVERALLSPLLVSIQKEFNFSYTLTTSLLVVRSLGLSLSLIASSFLATHITHKTIITLSIFFSGASFALLSMTTSYLQLQLGLLCFGLSAGLYFPSGMATLASMVKKEDLSKAFSIHELAPNIAFITAPFIVEIMLSFTDWRGAMRYVGIAAMLLALLFALLCKGGHDHGAPPRFSTLKRILTKRNTWIFFTLAGIGLTLEIAPYYVLPLFLVDQQNMTTADANSLLAISRLATPVMALSAGFVAGKTGVKPLLFTGFTLSGISLALMATMQGVALSAAIIAQPLFPAILFPVIFKLFSDFFPSEEQSLVLAITMPFIGFIGAGIMPNFMGYCGDVLSFEVGFGILSALTFASIVALFITPSTD
ncbi:MFS transporter [Halodesulfovibrio marinisediminis]|uniref:MFS transporter, NNP family, nitrate/nitrite transporter n=1 Tax=Halodesulfovibrio marinisediminis DSM 17456 TaxID=1121457 RepID=A0A1N6I6I6_9BACT|nr:MFS transporter [Halodesulfovibrio marinisediminis]SIO27613.1 MFS transporter, NNP family, nitrate/nitrite transporter [Halodesulfovibrio marinisediminis DSM 17456]